MILRKRDMSTLHSEPVSGLLTNLFAQASNADSTLRDELAKLPEHERSPMNPDYTSLYARARNYFLPVSKETGALLYLLTRTCKANAIVEFGTSFGISTIHMAAALRDNGGGLLIGSEFEPSKAARARENIVAAGLSDLVEIRDGDALESLSRDLPQRIDLVLLDGAKVLYGRVLRLLEPRLARGALVVADNADANPAYMTQMRQSADWLSVAVGPEVELSMRLG